MQVLGPTKEGVVPSAAYRESSFSDGEARMLNRKIQWMLLMSNAGLFVWGSGWCCAFHPLSYDTADVHADVKYKLGWVTVTGYGAIPYPDQLWDNHYKLFNTPLTICLNSKISFHPPLTYVDDSLVAFGLQSCLNAEEGLYW